KVKGRSGGTGARRRAYGHHGIGHVAHDGGAAAYGAVPPDMDKMVDVGAQADPALLADMHAAAQSRVGAYVCEVADDAVVFYGAAGIQNDARAYAGADVYDSLGEDGAAWAQFRMAADDGCGMGHADQRGAGRLQALLQFGPNRVVAY